MMSAEQHETVSLTGCCCHPVCRMSTWLQAHSGGQNALLRCQHGHQPLAAAAAATAAATAAALGLDRVEPGAGVAPSTSPPPLLQASQQQQLVPSSHATPLATTHTSVAMQHALRSDTPVAPLQQLTGHSKPHSLAALTATSTTPLSDKAAATAAAAAALLRRGFAPHSTSAGGGAGPSGQPAPHRKLFAGPTDQMPQQEDRHPPAAAATGGILAAGTHAVIGVGTAAGAHAEFPAHNSHSPPAAPLATTAAAAGGGGRSVGATMGCGSRVSLPTLLPASARGALREAFYRNGMCR